MESDNAWLENWRQQNHRILKYDSDFVQAEIATSSHGFSMRSFDAARIEWDRIRIGLRTTFGDTNLSKVRLSCNTEYFS